MENMFLLFEFKNHFLFCKSGYLHLPFISTLSYEWVMHDIKHLWDRNGNGLDPWLTLSFSSIQILGVLLYYEKQI